MAREQRKDLIKKLQTARGDRLLIAYITSTRPNHELQMADDAFRLIYDHLEANREQAKNGVDIFIHSNGGSGTVPWRVVSLIRQYTDHLAVLVPHHAFSAATLLALGANEIVMHKMGCLGPIDPSVTNPFNPPHPLAAGQLAPISVEEVTAFFELVKDEVGIHHEDELIQALTALTDKIHPLALGNVQRSHHQSRLMAKKLLKLHMTSESEEHEIELIIDNLKSNLFFHGHPINRDEAKKDLKLKVVCPPNDVESIMWDLYSQYEADMKLTEQFNIIRELGLKSDSSPKAIQTVTTAQIAQQMKELAQLGIGIPGITEQQLVNLSVAMLPYISGSVAPSAAAKVKLDPVIGAYVESAAHANVFKTDVTAQRTIISGPAGPQEAIRQEVVWQRWEREE